MPKQSAPPDNQQIYSVSRLNQEVRALLEGHFPPLWVEGEISNFARPRSGHWYFSLKDAGAQIRCAMFRGRNARLGFTPTDGMHVRLLAGVSLYEGRGDFQLIVEQMEEAGDGALQRAFEALKRQLAQAGLFDAAHKQALPALPRRIGVITSPTGAALRDILSVLRRRYPLCPVLIYPVAVQGSGAAEDIAGSIALADARAECDVLILARGGGSLEDLWAFNEAIVAHAIHKCRLPVVTGIGHEIDFTIADFVADQRAATPTAAAELISPDGAKLLHELDHLRRRLRQQLANHMAQLRMQVQRCRERLNQQHPAVRLRQLSQRLDELDGRLRRQPQARLQYLRARVRQLEAALLQHTPVHRVQRLRAHCGHLQQALHAHMAARLQRARQQLQEYSRALHTVSPLATLERGYAIVQDVENDKILRRAEETAPGATLRARLGQGALLCEVKEILKE